MHYIWCIIDTEVACIEVTVCDASPLSSFLLCSICFLRSCQDASGYHVCRRWWWNALACGSLWPQLRRLSSLFWLCSTWWDFTHTERRGRFIHLCTCRNTHSQCGKLHVSWSTQCFNEKHITGCSNDTVHLRTNDSDSHGLDADLSYLPVSDFFTSNLKGFPCIWWWICSSLWHLL